MATIVRMPHGSQTMDEGTVSKWHKTVGDIVKKGDIIVDIETDKAVIELEADTSGILHKIIVQEGVEVPVKTPLAIIGDEDEEIDLGKLI